MTLPNSKTHRSLALWAVTRTGAALAGRVADGWPRARRFVPASLGPPPAGAVSFDRLSEAVEREFVRFDQHVFIMAAGIVVRIIGGLLRRKTVDPAVVVMDEAGRFAISLVSGHVGGANALALRLADKMGATPVITTATDVHRLPAVDALAAEAGLFIENPEAIKVVNMAVLNGTTVGLHDPYGFLRPHLASIPTQRGIGQTPGIYVDDVQLDLPPQILVLRPRSLVLGMGCNRNTDLAELKGLLDGLLREHRLSPGSLRAIGSIDVKSDEPGLIALGRELGLPIRFFSREELGGVPDIQNPSETVKHHVGVNSVCEAAAILGAGKGRLIVPKRKSRNATAAVARVDWPSSASVPEDPITSPAAPAKS